jgi:hypothetical protein
MKTTVGNTAVVMVACVPMRATISKTCCASNYREGRYLSCRGCTTGAANAGGKRTAADIARESTDAHVRSAAKNAMPCIRCGRGPADSDTVMAHRLVWACWCVSCDMRSRECVANGGIGAINSKGGQSTKHRSLRAARLVVLMGDGQLLELRPMVFGSADEVRRYLDRRHEGWSAAEARHADGAVTYLESNRVSRPRQRAHTRPEG